jgi:hypothetical protein
LSAARSALASGPAAPATPEQDAEPAWPGDPYTLLNKIIADFEDAEMSSMEARELAERDRDYKDGKQWTRDEAAILRKRRQPLIYNNVIGRKIELLRGMERRGRSDPEAYPRTPAENVRADAATQALRYVSDENRFDVIRSSVYDQMLVEGFSGAEVIVEPQQDGDGYDVIINHVPWERLYYDPHSQHAGFTDAQFVGCVIWMDRDDAVDMYPDCQDILDSALDGSRSDTYDDKPNNGWCDSKRRRVRVVQHHWKKRKDWWVATLTKGGFLEPPMLSPYKDRHGNRSCPLILRSARVDRQNNRMGIVRDMIPLQDEINKRRSKLLHALSVNQILMEEGAVADVDKARSEAAKPDGVLVYNRGFEFKVQKDEADIQGQMHLLQDAVEQMNVTGPNAAMAGKDPREQSGRAIIAQQSGGQMENEPLADALRQWTHKIYEAAWCRVRQFWTGERWIRVTDDDKNTRFVGINHPVTIADLLAQLDQTQPIEAQLAALPKADAHAVQLGLQLPPNDPRLQTVVRIENDIDDLDVSITVEEGPDNPTMAAEQFQQIMALPPQVLQNFPPEFFIQASSLRNKDALLKLLEEHQAQQAQGQQAQQANQQAMQAAQVAKVQADAKDKNAQAVERLHGMALDHAGQPAAAALSDAQTANARAQTLGTLHGMAMDHAAAQQPPDNGLLAPDQAEPPDPLAVGQQAMAAQQQVHQQGIDRAKLALAAQQQGHAQGLALAQHGLAVQQANQPPATAPAAP